jgi:hypothetical protein
MSSERELSGSSPGRVNVKDRHERSKEEEEEKKRKEKKREGGSLPLYENQGFVVLL